MSPAYLASTAAQLGSISAFLGGFAATILATLVVSGIRSRPAALTIGLSAAAALAFIVSVVATTAFSAGVHPDAPSELAGPDRALQIRALMTLGFMVGVLCLMGAVAASGWLRSRGMGWLTTTLTLLAGAAVVFLTVRVG